MCGEGRRGGFDELIAGSSGLVAGLFVAGEMARDGVRVVNNVYPGEGLCVYGSIMWVVLLAKSFGTI